jgi:hypothetical protein
MESSSFSKKRLESLAIDLLEDQPNAIVRHRLLRDVLRQPYGSPDLEAARLQVSAHPWVKELAREQISDGSWGRFHSMDSSRKNRFPTSEFAIRRALALGLEKESPPLSRAVNFMRSVLHGRTTWSDHVEKTEGWTIAVEAITAATLAEVDPECKSILSAWEYWVSIAGLSFHAGTYNVQAEWKAHQERRGRSIHYLPSRYVLTLLGARSASLPASLDRRIVNWMWNNPAGIGYLGTNLQHPEPFRISNWLESLEILARFQHWREFASGAIAWLWDQRKADERWDFGSRGSRSYYFPLSDDWRPAGNRSMDHTTRILVLLRRFSND